MSARTSKGLRGAAPARRPPRTQRQAAIARAPLTVSREELLTDGSDREFRTLVHGLLAFDAVHAAIRDGYAALLGLAGPQYTIMLCIRTLSDSGPVNVRTVAEHLRLSGSFVTVETNNLERGGLLRKARGIEDRRMVALTLTSKGIALLDSIASLRQQVNDVEFGCLGEAEFRTLVPLVARLIQSGKQALALLDYLKAHRLDAAGAGSRAAALS